MASTYRPGSYLQQNSFERKCQLKVFSVDISVTDDEPRVFSDKASLMSLLKKYKSANPRFKVFHTEGEAEAFASQEQASKIFKLGSVSDRILYVQSNL